MLKELFTVVLYIVGICTDAVALDGMKNIDMIFRPVGQSWLCCLLDGAIIDSPKVLFSQFCFSLTFWDFELLFNSDENIKLFPRSCLHVHVHNFACYTVCGFACILKLAHLRIRLFLSLACMSLSIRSNTNHLFNRWLMI